jgi:dienelactone hydrolase
MTRTRNFSLDVFFNGLAKSAPRYRFNGGTRDEWTSWREQLLPQALASLGPMPATVPLAPEVEAEWRDDGLIKQRVIFDVESGLSVRGYIFRPEKSSGRLPAILCCHGHGRFGMGSVMGDRSSAERAAAIDAVNYDYGRQMAKSGFVTMAIDWRGFGERDDRRKPHAHDVIWGDRDPCNVHFLRAAMLGRTMLGANVNDGMRALDYLCAQDFVDRERIGVMGMSFGGTMTTWMAIADARIKAANIICYSDRFADFAIRDGNVCGSQITPGIFALCDVPDLHGLIAPRPLLAEIGIHDECFLIDSALSCQREVEKIYRAAGVPDRLELDLFEGGHRWHGAKSAAFFRKYLAP